MSESFADALRRLRRAAALTQEQLAARAGISARAVSDLERDPERVPRLSTVALLVSALGLGPDDERVLLSTVGASETSSVPIERAAVESVLPQPLTRLIGRESERETVAHLLDVDEHRLVTLTGPGGVGKTRLAVAAAQTLGLRSVFVDLVPVRDPALVIPAMARQLGVDDESRLPAALAGIPLLLVLDNLEQVVGVGPALLDLLATCPAVRLLATSRVPLRVRGEREFRLAPLRIPSGTGADDATDAAAYRLLLDRAQAGGYEPSEEEGPLLAEICRRLGGLPLALELAAARLSVLDAQGLLDALATTLPALVDGPQDLPARQRTMRETIAWSEDLLSVAARHAFHRMSVFPAGGTARDIETVCATSPSAVEEVVRAGLAHARREEGEVRLTMLEPVREFGIERLEAAGELDRVSRQHAAVVLDRLERQAFSAADLGGLRAALTWALVADEPELAHRLAALAAPHWIRLGALNEGQRLVDRVRSASDLSRVDPTVRLDVDLGALRLAVELWDTATAERLADDLVGRAEQEGTPAQQVRALVARGLHRRNLNAYAAAASDYERASAIATSQGDGRGLLEAVQALAYVRFFLGEMERARVLSEQAAALARELDDPVAGAHAQLMLAWGDSHAGAFERQVARADAAAKVMRAAGHTGLLAEALRILADGLSYLPDHGRAVAAFEESRALYAARGEDRIVGQVDSQLSYVVFQLGDLDRARALTESALATGRKYADGWAVAMCATILGHLALAGGDVDAARDFLAEGADAFEAVGNPLYVAWSLEGRAALAAHDGEWGEVDRLLAQRDQVKTDLTSQLPPFDVDALAAVMAARDAAARDIAAHGKGRTGG